MNGSGGVIYSLGRSDQAFESEHGLCDGESDLDEIHPHAAGLGRGLRRFYRHNHTSTDTPYVEREGRTTCFVFMFP